MHGMTSRRLSPVSYGLGPDIDIDIEQAAALLEAGGLLAFPTETVYGLGADAENPQAVANIYLAKGRPSDHPVIVHLAPEADLHDWAEAIPPQAWQLAAAFWPGPLTLILKRARHVPDAVSGGQDTVGLRCPSHPVAQALLRAFKGGKGGVAAPSANRFGNVSPTTAAHVRDEFGIDASGVDPAGLIAAVLDGGQSAVGIESTILDLSRMATHGPVLLRPGHISAAQIALVIGQLPTSADAGAPRASGTLEAHYAPNTAVAMQASSLLAGTLAALLAKGCKVALIHHSVIPHSSQPQADCLSVHLPAQPEPYAYALYAALRAMDQAGADLILIEAPPSDAQWNGINDRLRRAAHASTGVLQQFLS